MRMIFFLTQQMLPTFQPCTQGPLRFQNGTILNAEKALGTKLEIQNQSDYMSLRRRSATQATDYRVGEEVHN